MSTSTQERAVSGEGAGGTEGSSRFNAGSFYGEPPSAVFARPFLGWLALADAVADTDPDTAELMTAGAYLAQSALEERLPGLIGPQQSAVRQRLFPRRHRGRPLGAACQPPCHHPTGDHRRDGQPLHGPR